MQAEANIFFELVECAGDWRYCISLVLPSEQGMLFLLPLSCSYVAQQKGFKSTLVCYVRVPSELKVLWKGGKEGCHVACPGPLSCLHKRQNHSSMPFLQVPRLLNVILGNSPYFELISPSNEDYKVAPGMSSTYRILFRPDENKVSLEVPRDGALRGG